MLRKLLTGLALAGSLGIGSIALAGTASATPLPSCTLMNRLAPPNCVPGNGGGQQGNRGGNNGQGNNGNQGNGNNGNNGGQGGGQGQQFGDQGNNHQGDPGNQCQQGNTWKGGDIKTDAFPENGCCPQDNHGDLKFSDGNCDPAPPCNQGWDQKNFNQQDNWNNCLPQPKPPVNCHDQWGWQDSWVNVNGHETDHKTWGEGTCFTNYPEPKPAPKPCKCDVQTITFDFAPNLHAPDGTWLLETGGPALHDGETLSYDGGTWTVEQWDPHGNGSLGNDKPYFVLTNGHDLSGGGHSTQFAYTICSSIHPLFA